MPLVRVVVRFFSGVLHSHLLGVCSPDRFSAQHLLEIIKKTPLDSQEFGDIPLASQCDFSGILTHKAIYPAQSNETVTPPVYVSGRARVRTLSRVGDPATPRAGHLCDVHYGEFWSEIGPPFRAVFAAQTESRLPLTQLRRERFRWMMSLMWFLLVSESGRWRRTQDKQFGPGHSRRVENDLGRRCIRLSAGLHLSSCWW